MRVIVLTLLCADVVAYLLLQVWFTAFLRYLSVCLAYCVSLIALAETQEKIVPFALLFTLAADWFFVVCDPPVPLAAVSLFLVVQTLYFVRLNRKRDKKAFFLALSARTVVFLFLMGVFLQAKIREPLFYIAGVYALMFAENLAEGIAFERAHPFVFGLAFFLLCDIFVALSYLFQTGRLIPIESLDLAYSCRVLAWSVYPPSQMLIALSSFSGSETPLF